MDMSLATSCGSSSAQIDLIRLVVEMAGPDTFVIGLLFGAMAVAWHTLRRESFVSLALAWS